jgi:signal transduction histidine kinase
MARKNREVVLADLRDEDDALEPADGLDAVGEADAEHPREYPVSQPDRSVSTVLLIEPPSPALKRVIDLLTRHGYRVLRTHGERGIYDAFRSERIHAVVLDYGRFGDASHGIVHRLRAMSPAVPILIRGAGLGPAQRLALIRELDVNGFHDGGDDSEALLELIETAVATSRCIERLSTEQELRGLALAKLCHNLRSPLHVIQGYAELLQNEGATADFENILDRVAEATDTAVGLVHDYLDLARLEEPGIAVRRERVDVDDLVADLEVLASRHIGKRPLRFTAAVPREGAFVYTDGDKLVRILEQLVANAAQFATTGDIELGVRFGSDYVDFVVSDQGPGIGETDGPFVFNPFHQRREEYLSSAPGQGVGLAIAQRLSALIGGTLQAERGERPGATFLLRLPGDSFAPSDYRRGQTLH